MKGRSGWEVVKNEQEERKKKQSGAYALSGGNPIPDHGTVGPEPP